MGRGTCDDPNWDIRLLIAEAKGLAEYAQWTLDLLDLTPDARSELWCHADALRDRAGELRDMVRGCHPDLGF